MSQNRQLRRALVVEDEPLISRVCQRTLNTVGFAVDVAKNGLEARRLVANQQYDLCLSDIRTPSMNGVELYAHLKRVCPELARRTIFTTGDIMSGYIEEFLKSTGQPFLAKPFTPDELKATVALLCPEPVPA
jgi:CheY-like chemotaxis protein